MLDEEHFLGAGREAGERLCQFVLEQGEVVAVLIWCAAAWHIKDRDTLIGWDPVTRSQRLKLVVQLRRFLVPDKARRPNLASQCLGLGLRKLPAQWLEEHGYRPLMAESFSDPESHAGTVYRATNFIKTLRHAFENVPDPRRAQSRRHPLSAMLTLVALGLLMGGRDMLNIWRKVAKLDQRQRAAIGLKVREKQSGRLRMPCYDALNDLLNAIDPHAYAAALTGWLQANTGILPRSLALDGKHIGDGKCGMIV